MREEQVFGRGAVTPHPEGVVIEVWVVPGATRTEVVGKHGGALKVRVAAPPEGGKANQAVADLIAETLAVKAVELVSGHTGRRKRYVVKGIGRDAAVRRLES